MKLSEKKRVELYRAVHEEIVKARIEVSKLLSHNNVDGQLSKNIKNILSKANFNAPQKAIDLFK